MTFREKVLSAVQAIPKGSTATYKDIARAAGRSRAYRAVGAILKTNYDPAIPCHRVIRSDGRFGGYNRGKIAKKYLLKGEGCLLRTRRSRKQGLILDSDFATISQTR